jgi:uracil-DNA glycosylase
MSFQLDFEPFTFQLENGQIVLFHQIDDGFDIVELQNDILLVVGCMLCTGRKIAQAASQIPAHIVTLFGPPRKYRLMTALKNRLNRHVTALRTCHRCPNMVSGPISGGPVISRVILVGQAPGVKEPVLGRPFAWTAGKTLFKWFTETLDVDEDHFRSTVYMAAVCRCFPGKTSAGGDRVPSKDEVANCSEWLAAEIKLLRPELVIPVGKLAIGQFIVPVPPLTELIGTQRTLEKFGHTFDIVPLPHPSGASPWHRIEPGKTLTRRALELIGDHPGWRGREK